MSQLISSAHLVNELDQNAQLAQHVLQAVVAKGVSEFCFCPGSRNSPFFELLMADSSLTKYFWHEERSAAYFALGRCRESKRPVAVITTSGTAAGELLPATMDAYYTHDPLLLITADRPRRFRGKGAPQSAEQENLYQVYAPFFQDLAAGESCEIARWDFAGPGHLNVCFEEPKTAVYPSQNDVTASIQPNKLTESLTLEQFIERSHYPLVIVSAIPHGAREQLINFLLDLNAPLFLEATSGLREDRRLRHLRITRTEKLWENATKAGYAIDGILRIGGVPTIRLWRDLEDRQGEIAVCSISEAPFSGLSWAGVIHARLDRFFSDLKIFKRYRSQPFQKWLESDQVYHQNLHALLLQEPRAEASLIFKLSQKIPAKSLVFLGNSLPIREWDLAASDQDRQLDVRACRGINGIDGQISAFLGFSRSDRDNWAILGDLTALYDLSGPWIIPQLTDRNLNIVIVNNGGGMIFSRLFSHPAFLNPHQLNFEPLARFWGIDYQLWHQIPTKVESHAKRLIEIVPDNEASARFWKDYWA